MLMEDFQRSTYSPIHKSALNRLQLRNSLFLSYAKAVSNWIYNNIDLVIVSIKLITCWCSYTYMCMLAVADAIARKHQKQKTVRHIKVTFNRFKEAFPLHLLKIIVTANNKGTYEIDADRDRYKPIIFKDAASNMKVVHDRSLPPK